MASPKSENQSMSFSAATREALDVITTKHRNAPMGTVKLLFEPQ